MTDIVKRLRTPRLNEPDFGIRLRHDAANEITRLRKYRDLVWSILNEPPELSYDKIRIQRDYWQKACRKLADELESE